MNYELRGGGSWQINSEFGIQNSESEVIGKVGCVGRRN